MDEWLSQALHWTNRGIEVAGILVIVVGTIAAAVQYLRHRSSRQSGTDGFRTFRSSLGRSILLGLEFFIAADIIKTVAIEPTIESLVVLAAIVLIRTFLSFSFEVEIEDRWPGSETIVKFNREIRTSMSPAPFVFRMPRSYGPI